MAVTTALAATAAAATCMYLDGKYQISKDLANIRDERWAKKKVQSLANTKRLSLWYAFEEQANRLGDATCIWYRASAGQQPQTYTWQETYQRSLSWAQFLLQPGVQPNELVGTYLTNGPDFMFNMLGAWAIGCAPSLINYNLRKDALVHALKSTKSKVLIVDEDLECQARVEEMRNEIENDLQMRIIFLNEQTKAQIFGTEPTRPDNHMRDCVTRNSPAVIIFTSGTTGFPKPCAFQTYRAYGLTYPRLRVTGVKPGDVWFANMPMFHGTAITITWTCMLTGVTLAIGKKFSVSSFWQDIHDSNAAAFVYVGEIARYLLAAPPSALDRAHRLKAMHGNGLRPEVWKEFKKRFDVPTISEFFSSAEGGFFLSNPAKSDFFACSVGHHGAIKRRQNRNVLIPVKVDYRDNSLWRDPKTGYARRMSYEEGGELLVKCKTENDIAFPGYWSNPEATAKRFERDVLEAGDLYFRGGDALRRDSEGRWYFIDRLGDTFRWKSENVSTAEVAHVLSQFPGLIEANVYGVQVPHHEGRAGCAALFISAGQRQSLDYAGLLKYARDRLPAYAVPVFLRIVSSPALNTIYKQDKKNYKEEGVDLKKIRSGEAGKDDVILWAKPGASTYVPFDKQDWEQMQHTPARL